MKDFCSVVDQLQTRITRSRDRPQALPQLRGRQPRELTQIQGVNALGAGFQGAPQDEQVANLAAAQPAPVRFRRGLELFGRAERDDREVIPDVLHKEQALFGRDPWPDGQTRHDVQLGHGVGRAEVGLLGRIVQQPEAGHMAGMIAVKRAHEHGGVEESLHASAPSLLEGKAVDPGRMASLRASRSAAIMPVTSTGAGASPPR